MLESARGGSGPGGGCQLQGGLVPGGSALGGSGPWGVSGSGGFSLPGGGSPWPETPPVNRITHTCKNITLATTSLRPVKKQLVLPPFRRIS